MPIAEPLRRRAVLRLAASIGAGAVFARAVAVAADGRAVATPELIRSAEWIAGIELDDEKRRLLVDGVNELLGDFEAMRAVPLDNAVPPAVRFDPLPAESPTRRSVVPRHAELPAGDAARPAGEEELAFAGVAALARMIRAGTVDSRTLTALALERLERFDPQLACVVTPLAERARDAAQRADDDHAAGRWRGPLHGLPWGAKDLLAVAGAPTTWGAAPYRDRVLDDTATVVRRLDDAGSVLVAKLTLGALAMGDAWFGGRTNNPWNPEQGSSGSSAGSAAAVSAGLVPFAIGSETWGSIVSPCTRCGVTGLRPTFGRVSRHGAMALSWSMDKLGPIARSAEDCAIVFAAVHGADGFDPSAIDRPFEWPPRRGARTLRIGFAPTLFEEDRTAEVEDPAARDRLAAWTRNDLAVLEVLRGLGMVLRPISIASSLPVSSMTSILTAEAATAFDDLTRSGRDAELVRQSADAWPNIFRQGQLVPAVEYLRANRLRTLLVREAERIMSDVDVYVAPSFGGDDLLRTNLTGHPAVVVPNGLAAGTPTSIVFTGRLFGEADVLAVAHAYQRATDHHLRRPPVGGFPREVR